MENLHRLSSLSTMNACTQFCIFHRCDPVQTHHERERLFLTIKIQDQRFVKREISLVYFFLFCGIQKLLKVSSYQARRTSVTLRHGNIYFTKEFQ